MSNGLVISWFESYSTNVAIISPTGCRFQQNLAVYQNMITQSMYDKQLDSGRGTLLHLCDDVIQQEVSFGFDEFFETTKYVFVNLSLIAANGFC